MSLHPQCQRAQPSQHEEAVERTGDPADRIAGVVYEITQEELASTDDYEGDAYGRIEVLLESGAAAFVYIGPDA